MPLSDFIVEADQQRIVEAIGKAEWQTSGEIRVHIEPKCPHNDPMKRAAKVFDNLRMYETRQRNGVLVYIAYQSRMFAIIGDCGINDCVPDGFWNKEKDTLKAYLSQNRAADGICEVIAQIGQSLSEYFPWADDDVNEQSDDISYAE